MANYSLTQTGAEVQADLDKVEGMVNITSIGSGLSLTSGELSATGGGGSTLYRHNIYADNGVVGTGSLQIISTRSTAYDFATLVSFLYNAGCTSISHGYPWFNYNSISGKLMIGACFVGTADATYITTQYYDAENGMLGSQMGNTDTIVDVVTAV